MIEHHLRVKDLGGREWISSQYPIYIAYTYMDSFFKKQISN